MPTFKSGFIEVCIFKRDASGVQFLLLQRSPTEKLFPNIWQIITAGIEQGETALQTARREIEEETKLKPVTLWNVPYVNTFFNVKQDTINFIPFFAAEVTPESIPEISDEHQSFGWFTCGEAKERLVWPGQRQGLDIVHEFIVGKKEAEKLSRVV